MVDLRGNGVRQDATFFKPHIALMRHHPYVDHRVIKRLVRLPLVEDIHVKADKRACVIFRFRNVLEWIDLLVRKLAIRNDDIVLAANQLHNPLITADVHHQSVLVVIKLLQFHLLNPTFLLCLLLCALAVFLSENRVHLLVDIKIRVNRNKPGDHTVSG